MAYFRLRSGKGPFISRGVTGTPYLMSDKPVLVTEPRDAAKFRNQRDALVEVTETGEVAEVPRPTREEMTIYRPDRSGSVTQPPPIQKDTAITTDDLPGKRVRRIPKPGGG